MTEQAMHLRELPVPHCASSHTGVWLSLAHPEPSGASGIPARPPPCAASWRQLLTLARPPGRPLPTPGYFLSVIMDTRSLARVAYAGVIILPTKMRFFQRRKWKPVDAEQSTGSSTTAHRLHTQPSLSECPREVTENLSKASRHSFQTVLP